MKKVVMAADYIKTDTMRIKISGAHLRGNTLDELQVVPESPADDESGSETFEREFNEFLESVYDAVMITDVNGAINKYNTRCLNYFNYSMQEFYRINVLNIISGADEQTLSTIYQTLLSERRIFIEGFCVCKDQTVFPADIAVSILHLHGHERLAFFIRNISARVQTEEALRDAQQELVETAHHAGMAEIATGVLHDVGNLLNSINVSCEVIMETMQESATASFEKVNRLLLAQDDPGGYIQSDPKGQKIPLIYKQLGEKLQAEQKKMRDESLHLKGKIEIIRDVISTQQTYAKTGLFFEECKVETLVEDALAILKSSLDKSNLNIEKNFISAPPVHAQKSKFVHIILNLLKNARDALVKVEQQGIIRIDIYQDNPDIVCVRVTDNGEGISKEDLEKIFTHGFTTKQSGHGFGLHSCANLMNEMGGNIQVHSEGKGKGAVFTLTLPVFKG